MSALGKLFGRAKRAPRLSASTVEHDRIDEYVLKDLRAQSERFDGAVAEPMIFTQKDGSRAAYEPSELLRSDLFYALHSTRPDVAAKGQDEVKPKLELNRQLISHLLRNEDYLRTHARTRGDKYQSGIALRAMDDELQGALNDEQLREHADRANEMDSQEQRQEQLQELLEQLRAQAREQAEKGEPIDQSITDAVKQATAERQNARQELAQLMEAQDQAGSQVVAAVAQAAQQAAERAQQTTRAFAELAGLDAEAASRLSADEAFALADLWASKPELRDLAARVGRFKRDFRSKAARRVTGGREERVGVELGNDLSRVVSSELATLTHPQLRVVFLKNYIDRGLVQYEVQGEEPAGLGPCIIALDLSSSMSTAARHLYAKAVSIATIANVRRDNRTCGLVTFNGAVTGTWLFPKGRPLDLRAITDFATMGPSGGTQARLALEWAEGVIDAEPDFTRADIVLITDGEDAGARHPAPSEQLRTRLTEKGVRVFGVTVGTGATAYTNLMCDDQVSVHKLLDPSPATDRLATAVAA